MAGSTLLPAPLRWHQCSAGRNHPLQWLSTAHALPASRELESWLEHRHETFCQPAWMNMAVQHSVSRSPIKSPVLDCYRRGSCLTIQAAATSSCRHCWARRLLMFSCAGIHNMQGSTRIVPAVGSLARACMPPRAMQLIWFGRGGGGGEISVSFSAHARGPCPEVPPACAVQPPSQRLYCTAVRASICYP